MVPKLAVILPTMGVGSVGSEGGGDDGDDVTASFGGRTKPITYMQPNLKAREQEIIKE